MRRYFCFSCWPEKFRCLDHQCVDMGHRCDGIWDCEKGEDEISCDNVCKGGQFTCKDHKTCIPANRYFFCFIRCNVKYIFNTEINNKFLNDYIQFRF